MSQTVIGFFDDASEAQKAIDRLQSIGISRDRIDISGMGNGSFTQNSGNINPVSGSERDENSVRRTSDDRTVDRDSRNTNKITDFFNNLFGGRDNDNDDAGRYSHVAQKSNSIVTVHSHSKEEAERVADILDDCGAVDVNEKAKQYGYTGTSQSREENNVGLRSRIVDRSVDEERRLRDDNF